MDSSNPDITLIKGFTHFAFDNADFNTNTLDDNNTFHTMGDIKCTTSAFNIERSAPVPRIKEEVHADVNDTLKTCPPDIQKAGHTWIAACYHQRPVSVSRGNLSIQNNNHEAEFSVDGRLFYGNRTKAIIGWSHAASRAKLRKVQSKLS